MQSGSDPAKLLAGPFGKLRTEDPRPSATLGTHKTSCAVHVTSLGTKDQRKSRAGLGGLRRDAHRLDAYAQALCIHGPSTTGKQADGGRAGRGQLQVCRLIPGGVAEGFPRLCSGEVKAAVLKTVRPVLEDSRDFATREDLLPPPAIWDSERIRRKRLRHALPPSALTRWPPGTKLAAFSRCNAGCR